MTAPNQRAMSGMCTDYSPFNLGAIYASVNQPDNVTWPQIDAWEVMARACGEQATQLRKALDELMQTWPPTPNSAAASFQSVVLGMITAMKQDATDAETIQPVLAGIVEEINLARTKIEPLVDQETHNVAVEQAHQAGIGAQRGAKPGSDLAQLLNEPYPPSTWRDDLHAQASAIMQDADTRIDALTARMPVLHRERVNVDLGGSAGATPSGQGGVGQLPASANGRVVPHRLNLGTTDPGLSEPTLAGQPVGSAPSLIGPGDGGPHPGSGTVSVGFIPKQMKASQSVTRALPLNGVIGGVPASGNIGPGVPNSTSSAGTAGAEANEGSSVARAADNGQLLPASSAMRRGNTPNRQSVRPGGRAALWASQRRRNANDSTDPWSVRKGIPAVIEPVDPPEHDPGPGVIGYSG